MEFGDGVDIVTGEEVKAVFQRHHCVCDCGNTTESFAGSGTYSGDKPISQRAYKTDARSQEIIDETIDKLLHDGIHD